MIPHLTGQQVETGAAWLGVVALGVVLAGHYIRQAITDRARNQARWLAQSDADFAEHADEAIALAQDGRAQQDWTKQTAAFIADAYIEIEQLTGEVA